MKYNQNTVDRALKMLSNQIKEPDFIADNPSKIKPFLQCKIAQKEHEVFCVAFLTNQHELIEFKEMFRGTINAAQVYPREVVKEALKLNAAAVILAHNHPSGVAEPSLSDIDITRTLKDILKVVDVRVLDHFIVTAHQVTSLAERGQI